MYRIFKRILDVLISLIILGLFGWMIFLLIIISTVDTRAFGLYQQIRIGYHGKEFSIFKIRTMRRLIGYNSFTTTSHDPRITKLGMVFRRYKIDELPQVLNVLLGQMSFVGPRPTVREDFLKMDAIQKQRNTVRPGITGLAQINGNTYLSWPERIKFDIIDLDELSFSQDLSIVWNTVRLILKNKVHTDPKDSDEWLDINS